MSHPRLPAAALFLFLLPASALACSCMLPKPYAERRLDYPAVFHGTVIDMGLDSSGSRRWIRFHMIKDYSVKAVGAESLTVWTGIHDGVCGVEYPIGAGTLIFAVSGIHRPTQAPVLTTNICSGNASGAGLEPALQEMERTSGVRPRRTWAGLRRGPARVDCGQVIFAGEAQANGVLRGSRRAPVRGRED